MRLKDTELDIARLLEAAGLGTLSGPTPTLFAGPYPANAPDAFLACQQSSAEPPAKYLGTGAAYHVETVTVLVRGTREPDGYTESRNRAEAAWEALFEARPAGYVRVEAESRPHYLGPDEDDRPQWSFTVSVEYASAPS